MGDIEKARPYVILCVSTAASTLDYVAQYCEPAGEATDLPKAFPVVAKHLHMLREVFAAILAYLKSINDDKEDQKLSEMYPKISEAIQGYDGHVTYLKQLFGTVMSSSDNAELKMKKYQSTVQNNKGRGLEKVMLYLLNGAILMAQEPLVTDVQIKRLKEALEEVKNLPPPIDDCPAGSVVMNHFGGGHQFHHGGSGHQNICSGGLQITGNNERGTYNYMTKAEEAVKS